MKAACGLLLVLAGIAFGVWAGLWWAFVGGIIQIIDALQASPVVGADIALGIVRVVFAGFIGGITAFVAIIPGAALLSN